MFRIISSLFLFCAGCGVNEKPEWAETVAAYEVPLPTATDKARFIQLLSREAKAEGFHVDAATPNDLAAQSEISPITFNTSVWRGNDEESMASAMDFKDHIGRVWISFPLGQDPIRSARFRKAVVANIKKEWPGTTSLPIMPSGAIPLTRDLIRTTSGYIVNPYAAAKYEKRSN